MSVGYLYTVSDGGYICLLVYLHTLTILHVEHLLSAPFSPHVVQNSASIKPIWPVIACVSTENAVGSEPWKGKGRWNSSFA